ncbi:MAG: squalene/phytoene synthase family protein, partial [Proteobacteria bacterium]|nr:squalene/phytoene synthase family protein [Pseudomonadota bacterium]
MTAPRAGLSYCAGQARRYDRDRYLCALFAPAARREALFALLAFNAEVARIRETVSEPMLGLIRLQWWRDAIAGIYAGAPPRHAVVEALSLAVERHGLGRGEFDFLIGGAGNDTLSGGLDNDTLVGGAGDDTLDGGSGTDVASYAHAADGVTVDLSDTGPQLISASQGSDTLAGIETVVGSAFADTLTGDANANLLEGGAGDDTLEGGAGVDTLDGGADIDTASYVNAAGAVTVDLSSNTASDDGDGASDTLVGIENVTGSGFGDTITGDSNANVLVGNAGDDSFQFASANL